MSKDNYLLLERFADRLRFDAIRKAREWAASLHHSKPPSLTPSVPLSPRYSAEDLLALVNPDIRKPFDMKEVLLRIVDDSRLSIFKPAFGINMVTTWAHILGLFHSQSPIA